MKPPYITRIIDTLLEERLEFIGAILIAGPKWCGKTTTAERYSKSSIKLQDPDKVSGYLETVKIKPSILLQGANPRLIDEWQVAPVLWDAVRHMVDQRGESGLFILTGSTSIDESTIMHSGTGRIARMVMRPMSLFESKESNGQVSLNHLFNKAMHGINVATSDLTMERLIFAACRGGWPSSLSKRTDKAMLFESQNYVASICESDVSKVDGIQKDPARVRTVFQSYARNVSTLASDMTIMRDVAASHAGISEPTLHAYINALERLYVIEDIPAWCPSIRSATTMRSSKKKGFIDPSIAVASLALSPEALLLDLNTFGFIFECLCYRDLNVYSSGLDGYVSYYRDRYGLEADCVLHLPDGRYGLIEFKLGGPGIDEGAAHLLKLKDLVLKANGNMSSTLKEPSFLMVLTGGEIGYTRPDGVHVVPIGCLRD